VLRTIVRLIHIEFCVFIKRVWRQLCKQGTLLEVVAFWKFSYLTHRIATSSQNVSRPLGFLRTNFSHAGVQVRTTMQKRMRVMSTKECQLRVSSATSTKATWKYWIPIIADTRQESCISHPFVCLWCRQGHNIVWSLHGSVPLLVSTSFVECLKELKTIRCIFSWAIVLSWTIPRAVSTCQHGNSALLFICFGPGLHHSGVVWRSGSFWACSLCLWQVVCFWWNWGSVFVQRRWWLRCLGHSRLSWDLTIAIVNIASTYLFQSAFGWRRKFRLCWLASDVIGHLVPLCFMRVESTRRRTNSVLSCVDSELGCWWSSAVIAIFFRGVVEVNQIKDYSGEVSVFATCLQCVAYLKEYVCFFCDAGKVFLWPRRFGLSRLFKMIRFDIWQNRCHPHLQNSDMRYWSA